MADYSTLSDADLMKMLQPQAAAATAAPTDYSHLSDADLLKMVQPQAQPSVTDTALGLAKQGGVGLAKGAIGMAGMIPQASDALHNVANKYLIDPILNATVGPPQSTKKLSDLITGADGEQPPNVNKMFSPAGIQSGIESVTGPFRQPQNTGEKYAETIGEFAPGLMGGGAGLARRAVTQVALPAVASETAGQATQGTAAEPYARVAGALLSPLATSAARRVITPFPASAERTALVNTLRGEGVDVTAGQATGSKPLQWMESTLGDMPGSGGRAADIQTNQGEQFTRAALRRVGEDAPRADGPTIDNAFNRVGGQFDAIGGRNDLVGDAHLGNDLTNVEGEYNGLVSPSQRAPVVANTIRDIGDTIAANGGHMTGEQYNAMSSRLARQARGANADPQLREALAGTREALDDAFERSLQASGNTQDLAALREARNQYRNLMVVEKAATGAGSATAEGIISPSQLRNATVSTHGRRNYARGQGDFADLSRAGEAIMKPLPNSGTAPRQYMQHALSIAAGTVGGTAAGIPGAVAGLAAPALAGRIMMSRPAQAYLGNQLLRGGVRDTPRDAIVRALLASGGGQSLLPK